MNNKYNCDDQLYSSGLKARFSASLTDTQWIVLERRVIYGDTLESIGGDLGVASARVRYIQSKAIEELNKLFHEEIECFSIKLEKLFSSANSALTIKECLASFTSISEAEFVILFAVCQNNRTDMFDIENDLISLISI